MALLQPVADYKPISGVFHLDMTILVQWHHRRSPMTLLTKYNYVHIWSIKSPLCLHAVVGYSSIICWKQSLGVDMMVGQHAFCCGRLLGIVQHNWQSYITGWHDWWWFYWPKTNTTDLHTYGSVTCKAFEPEDEQLAAGNGSLCVSCMRSFLLGNSVKTTWTEGCLLEHT